MGDPRMVSGPAISEFIFFRVSDVTAAPSREAPTTLRAALAADPRQEVWLESSGGALESLAGVLKIVRAEAGAAAGGRLRRGPGDAYALTLEVSEGWDALANRLLQGGPGPVLSVAFDVHYHEGWESPGGYDPGYGVRYWDDVRYPEVEVARFEVV